MLLSFSSAPGPVAILAVATVLSVLFAGCVVQDRPHEQELLVVADAGPDAVASVGEAVTLRWTPDNATVYEGGEPAYVDAEFAWYVGNETSPRSTQPNLTLQSTTPGLVAAHLAVTAQKTTAKDTASVLFIEGPTSHVRKAYVAFVGKIAPEVEGTISGLSVEQIPPEGTLVTFDLPAPAQPVKIHILLEDGGSFALGAPSVEGSILIAIRDGPGAARAATTQKVELEADESFTLLVDPTPAANHQVEVTDSTGDKQTLSLEGFAHDHAAEEKVEVAVVKSQTLPGLDAALAVAAAVFAVAVVAVRRR